MKAQLTFNLDQAIVMKDMGINRVANNNEEFLQLARNIARVYAMEHGEVTSDDVRKRCRVTPLHHNAWGAVFKGKEWEWTGKYRNSHSVSRHGGLQRVWRLRDESS